MILKAIGQGVSEKRIASTLNVDVGAIRRKQNLLEGICPEAVQLLKDRRVSPDALRELKRVISIRQIEMADLMCSVNNYTSSYAHSLFIATPEEQRVPECRPKKGDSLSADDRDRMRHEMQNLHRELKLIEKTHSENVLNLVVAVRYVQALMENSRVYKFLVAHFPEIAKEFQEIIDTPELAGSASRGKG